MSDHLDRLEKFVPTDLALGGHRRDVAALCAECRRLRADNAFYERVFRHDVTDDSGKFQAGWEAGAARQLAECVRVLEERARQDTGLGEFVMRKGVAMLTDLGPVRPPLPAERLEAENARLRELAQIVASGERIHDAYFLARRLLGLPAVPPLTGPEGTE